MVDKGTKVFVYRNLRKNLYSVKVGNKVQEYTDYIILKDVKYVVREKGRERVLREKQKNVHAGLRGFVVDINEIMAIKEWSIYQNKITYNPYKYKSFVRVCNEEPIFSSDYALMKFNLGKPIIYAIDK